MLQNHELIRVGVPGDEEQVEHTDRALPLELCELVRDASLEVRPGLEAHGHQLNGTDLREIAHAGIVGGGAGAVITPTG